MEYRYRKDKIAMIMFLWFISSWNNGVYSLEVISMCADTFHDLNNEDQTTPIHPTSGGNGSASTRQVVLISFQTPMTVHPEMTTMVNGVYLNTHSLPKKVSSHSVSNQNPTADLTNTSSTPSTNDNHNANNIIKTPTRTLTTTANEEIGRGIRKSTKSTNTATTPTINYNLNRTNANNTKMNTTNITQNVVPLVVSCACSISTQGGFTLTILEEETIWEVATSPDGTTNNNKDTGINSREDNDSDDNDDSDNDDSDDDDDYDNAKGHDSASLSLRINDLCTDKTFNVSQLPSTTVISPCNASRVVIQILQHRHNGKKGQHQKGHHSSRLLLAVEAVTNDLGMYCGQEGVTKKSAKSMTGNRSKQPPVIKVLRQSVPTIRVNIYLMALVFVCIMLVIVCLAFCLYWRRTTMSHNKQHRKNQAQTASRKVDDTFEETTEVYGEGRQPQPMAKGPKMLSKRPLSMASKELYSEITDDHIQEQDHHDESDKLSLYRESSLPNVVNCNGDAIDVASNSRNRVGMTRLAVEYSTTKDSICVVPVGAGLKAWKGWGHPGTESVNPNGLAHRCNITSVASYEDLPINTNTCLPNTNNSLNIHNSLNTHDTNEDLEARFAFIGPTTTTMKRRSMSENFIHSKSILNVPITNYDYEEVNRRCNHFKSSTMDTAYRHRTQSDIYGQNRNLREDGHANTRNDRNEYHLLEPHSRVKTIDPNILASYDSLNDFTSHCSSHEAINTSDYFIERGRLKNKTNNCSHSNKCDVDVSKSIHSLGACSPHDTSSFKSNTETHIYEDIDENVKRKFSVDSSSGRIRMGKSSYRRKHGIGSSKQNVLVADSNSTINTSKDSQEGSQCVQADDRIDTNLYLARETEGNGKAKGESSYSEIDINTVNESSSIVKKTTLGEGKTVRVRDANDKDYNVAIKNPKYQSSYEEIDIITDNNVDKSKACHQIDNFKAASSADTKITTSEFGETINTCHPNDNEYEVTIKNPIYLSSSDTKNPTSQNGEKTKVGDLNNEYEVTIINPIYQSSRLQNEHGDITGSR